jgi:hypothetical protein
MLIVIAWVNSSIYRRPKQGFRPPCRPPTAASVGAPNAPLINVSEPWLLAEPLGLTQPVSKIGAPSITKTHLCCFIIFILNFSLTLTSHINLRCGVKYYLNTQFHLPKDSDQMVFYAETETGTVVDRAFLTMANNMAEV